MKEKKSKTKINDNWHSWKFDWFNQEWNEREKIKHLSEIVLSTLTILAVRRSLMKTNESFFDSRFDVHGWHWYSLSSIVDRFNWPETSRLKESRCLSQYSSQSNESNWFLFSIRGLLSIEFLRDKLRLTSIVINSVFVFHRNRSISRFNSIRRMSSTKPRRTRSIDAEHKRHETLCLKDCRFVSFFLLDRYSSVIKKLSRD